MDSSGVGCQSVRDIPRTWLRCMPTCPPRVRLPAHSRFPTPPPPPLSLPVVRPPSALLVSDCPSIAKPARSWSVSPVQTHRTVSGSWPAATAPAAALWSAPAGVLWLRTTIAMSRLLAARAGVPRTEIGDLVRLSFVKVAEFQTRGLAHLHVILRRDGPERSAPPAWATTELLADIVAQAAMQIRLRIKRPDGAQLEIRWGSQFDIRSIRPNRS